MKRLYVNGKYLSQPITGVQRYAHDLLSAWDDALEEGRIDPSRFEIQVVAPGGEIQSPAYRNIRIIHSALRGKLWEQWELPLRTAGALLFSPYAAAPLAKRRHVVTIHDAGVRATPQQYSWAFRAYYSAVYRWLGWWCPKVLTVSQFSKGELHRFFSLPLDKLVVVPPGSDHLLKVQPNPAILNRFQLEAGRFVLGVSSRSPIKNFRGLAQSWTLLKRPGLKLAIAGKSNAKVFGQGESESETGVLWLGYVSDAELRALYEAAALFVYPSFYEGFGYPPLEAMSCGCPVVVGRSSALPESCGEAPVYCNPSDVEDIARKIATVLDDAQLASELRSRGKVRAGQLTMERAASVVWQEIESCF